LFERLRISKLIDKIILATSYDHDNDILSGYVEGMGFDVFRGSETDVLERFYLAAKPYNPDYVVRITGDCPLIDPNICDRLFQAILDQRVDYAELSPDFAEGADCEILTFKALEEAYHNAVMKSEREHVTLYINNHHDQFQTFLLSNETNDAHYRYTVDEQEDLDVVKAIIQALYRDKNELFTYQEIKHFLDSNPEIMNHNTHIIRNEGLEISLRNDEAVKDKVNE